MPLIALATILLVTLAVVYVPQVPAEADHVVERAVIEDPAGELRIDDVVNMAFASMPAVLAASYTPSVHWVRLRVRASSDGRPLVLRIRPTFLDTVTLFEPDPEGSGWRTRVTGDMVPYGEREVAAAALALEIAPKQPETTYYLRLETTSSSLMGVQALDWHEMRRAELMSDALLVGFLAITWCILLWSIGNFVARAEAITFIFIVSQICYMLYVLAVTGYLAPFVSSASPTTINTLTNILVCLTPAVGVMLHRQVFLVYAPARIVSVVGGVMCAFAFALTGMVLAGGYTQLALRANSTLIFVSSTFYFAMAFWPWKERAPSILLRTLYGVQALAFVISIAPLLGIISMGEWTLNYPYILVLTYGAMMFLVIHSRAKEREVLESENQARLDLVSQALDSERRQRDIQDRFTAMLVHEIRNPLSAIRLSADPASLGPERYRDIRDALAEIDATVERCSMGGVADALGASARGARFDVVEALREVVARHAPSNPVRFEAEGPMTVENDRHMVNVVLSNLVENAIKYARPDTPIRLDCRRVEKDGARGIVISVENEPGRAAAPDPRRVFDKFYRAPGARSEPGSGLGLYVVAGVTDLLSGTIDCTIADGKVRFDFWLPLVLPNSGGEPAAASAEVTAEAEGHR
ncbi:sensor histidine kinase [Aquibium carbonis]|uniref:sensor histidine kinase n=1 Tax=Aquibium carbonis TaxID=2495581 RepID=UPI001478C246|nr:sensor histidine kinase [Aquibium carbonis]